MKCIFSILGLTVGIVFLFTSGCVSHRIGNAEKYNVNGIQYGATRGNFRARWWNFYERGRSFADGSFWKEAELDLRMALERRSIDNRRSRTYGLHFTPYFGNRELGIVLYHQGQIREAIPFLQRSIDQDTTEKAEFYLNLCQQQLSQSVQDNENPTLRINDLPEITNSAKLAVTGDAFDNHFVNWVRINGKESGDVLKSKKLRFEQDLQLVTGPNIIEVTAEDTSGNRIVERKTVILDDIPPLISIVSLSVKEIVLDVMDENSVRPITGKLENLKLINEMGNQFTFQPSSNASSYHAQFEDVAHNRNGVSIDPRHLQLGYHLKGGSLSDPEFPTPILLASREIPPGLLAQRNSDRAEHQHSPSGGLSIEVEGLLPEMKVFQDHIILAGRVNGKFKLLKLNNQVRLEHGKDVRFCFRKSLNLGHNLLVLEISDSNGGKHVKKFNIERLPAPKKNRELRAKIMLHPLAKEGGDRTFSADEYSNLLVELDESERFRVLEEERLDVIKREFDLVIEGLVRENTAVKVGRRFDADYTLICTIRPTKNDIEIIGRIVDIETSEILATCDVYELVSEHSDFYNTYNRFVQKLVQEFPIIEWKVAERSAGKLIIDAGADVRIKEGMLFVAYHHTDPISDPETGEFIIQGRVVEDGEVVVRTVKKRSTHLHCHDDGVIHRANYVVSK